MKILLDLHGGDHPIDEFIFGCVEALSLCANLSLVLVGDENSAKASLDKVLLDKAYNKINRDRIEFINATDVVTNEDVPTDAIRNKKESSMVIALEATKIREDISGMVTAGSTGAALTGATLKIGRIQGVRRAALAPILPTLKGGRVCIIDGGANIESTPEFLEQFALMGSIYMQSVYGIEKPRVALLSNGTEDKKGNALVQGAFPLLKKLPINFVGNMEAREAISGDYDVIVCDGFVGNVLLKALEGSLYGFKGLLKGALTSGFRSKMGALLAKPSLKKAFKPFTLDELGAAAFLGCSKLVAKAHGSSKAGEIKAALLQVHTMAEANITNKIKTEIGKIITN
ncbi:MAG: phosphate acyltransferase PlsX [Firmicutes bacterium]|nr:phosphate acyltransferase PlsX [Bacillota bacterium]